MRWYQRFFRRGQTEKHLDAELRFHLEQRIADLVGAGMAPEEARRRARLEFGGLDQVKEECRDVGRARIVETLIQDLRYGARMLRKNIGYTALAIVVLALGIGVNAAIFSAVNAALLRPLPFPRPERLMQVMHIAPKNVAGGGMFGVATGNFVEWHAQQHSFDGIALYHFHGLNLTGGDRPDALQGAEVSQDFFHVLGVQPLLGRTFTPDEMQPGNEREVVLSYPVWQTYFGADPSIIGLQYSFDRENYTIIGVMPKGFRFPSWAKIWVPAAWSAKDRSNRNNHSSMAVGRLRDGVILQQAQAEMDAISRRLAERYPAEDAGWGAIVVPLHENMTADARTPLLVLFGAVFFVLLIACSNVANLVFAKTFSRGKEIAIRNALGASRGRVIQLVLVETVLVALAGGGLGLLFARYSLQPIVSFLGNRLPSTIEVRLDSRVLLFTLAISVTSGVLAGLLPAWCLTKRNHDLQGSLKEGLGWTDVDEGSGRTRSALLVVEVALSMVLLIGAGLLVKTLWVLYNTSPGFDPHQVLTMVLPRPGRGDFPFMQRVLERTRALPGVQSAGITSNIPLSGSNESTWSVQIEGQPPLPIAKQPDVATDVISPGYFSTLHIPLLRGRDFTEADTAGHPCVIIINEAMARRFWPNEDAVGKRLFVSWTEPEKAREVVGVVSDTKDRGLERLRPLPQMYVPVAQSPFFADSLLIRSALPAANIVPSVTQVIHELDRQQPVVGIETMEQVIAESYADRRSNMLLLAAFAGLALVLAAAGIYGVLSYSVRRRMREIGIRMALGANVNDVLRLVVLEGMWPTAVGIAIGIGGALTFARVFATMVFGVRPTDPRTYISVAVLLGFVSLLACVVPAYRATRVQPLSVLRDE
jgi:predicted permease